MATELTDDELGAPLPTSDELEGAKVRGGARRGAGLGKCRGRGAGGLLPLPLLWDADGCFSASMHVPCTCARSILERGVGVKAGSIKRDRGGRDGVTLCS